MDYSLEEKYNLIKKKLLNENNNNPITIVRKIMHEDYISIHGPEHHFLDGGSLLVAMKNSGLNIDLVECLDELAKRSIKMPGAMCGFWGVCGSITSIGAVFSIVDATGPLSNDNSYKKHMSFTSRVISKMSDIGGPRCCKRNAYISISEGIKYANEEYGLDIALEDIKCEFSECNRQCIKERCPYYLLRNN